MSRNKILLVAILMAGLSAVAVAEAFSVDVWLENSTAKTLTFGMQSEKYLDPLPPFTPWVKKVYLEGPGRMADVVTKDEDYTELSTYMKQTADAGMWKLCIINENVKITFKVTAAPSNGSVLKVYPEGEEE